jgi:Putative porin
MKTMHTKTLPAMLASAGLLFASLGAQAQTASPQEVDALRRTTDMLIEALVQSGTLSRDKVDALVQKAKADAAQARADAPAAKPVVRVPHVPEALRKQIKDEVREEVIAQAQAERWGVANAVPSWTQRITLSGDIRYRHQADFFDKDNTPGNDYLASELGNSNGLTRAPDFAGYQADQTGKPNSNVSTTDSRTRERLRLRLGLTAKVTDEVGVGVRLATGSETDRVSTNQTLGNNFNKYQLFVDRAFIRLDPSVYTTIQAGRIANPWFSSEMSWSENLNFDGLAATGRWASEDLSWQPFATAGWFPLRAQNAPASGSRSLLGAQVGLGWQLNERTKLKFGLAYYKYRGLEGKSDEAFETGLDASGNQFLISKVNYGQYEYGRGLRQKGNTLFETNPSSLPDSAPLYGLAYEFKPLVLTAAAEFSHFSPYAVTLTGEWATNTGVDDKSFHQRAGAAYDGVTPGGRKDAYYLKASFGMPDVRQFAHWQVSASYRRVGSDAVLDAFTDSDLGLGGTNIQGFTIGAIFGLDSNTTIGVRYLSGKSLSTTLNEANPEATFKVNGLQVDLNVKF